MTAVSDVRTFAPFLLPALLWGTYILKLKVIYLKCYKGFNQTLSIDTDFRWFGIQRSIHHTKVLTKIYLEVRLFYQSFVKSHFSRTKRTNKQQQQFYFKKDKQSKSRSNKNKQSDRKRKLKKQGKQETKRVKATKQ